MKLASTLFCSAALALGSFGLTVAPAFAAKPAAAPAPQLSKEFRPLIQAAQTAVKANDAAGANAKLAAAAAIATGPDEKFYVGAIRLDLGNATKNDAIRRQAVNEMIASGSGIATNLGQLNFVAGQFAYQSNDYADAFAKLSASDRLGFKNVDLPLLLAESCFKLNRNSEGFAYIDRAVADSRAAGTKPSEDWFRRAISVAYKAKMNVDVAKWARADLKEYPTPENWRTALVTYRDSANLQGQQLLDLMRLMRLTKSLAGERDFYEFAALATERALPGEAKSSIEEGYASGAVSKSSRAVSEMLTMASGKIASDRAALLASEKQAAAGSTGKVAAGTADGFLGYGEDAKAAALYKTALQKGGVDVDQVNLRLGIALARQGLKDDARKAFALVKGPRADTAQFWNLWLDLKA